MKVKSNLNLVTPIRGWDVTVHVNRIKPVLYPKAKAKPNTNLGIDEYEFDQATSAAEVDEGDVFSQAEGQVDEDPSEPDHAV